MRSSDDALVATDGRALLVSDGATALWLRPAGGAWIDVGNDGNVFPRPPTAYSVSRVVRAANLYVAFGEEAGRHTSWLSPDGLTWAGRADPDGVFGDSHVDGLTAGNGVLVAAGAGPPTVPNVTNVAAVWISDDGGNAWRRVDPGNPAFSIRRVTQMFDLTSGSRGLVAVGLSWDNVTIDAHAWYSPDGRIWRRATDPAAWSGSGDQVMGDVCALPDGGFLALGYSTVLGERNDWAWLSSDGMTWEQTPIGGPQIPGGRRLRVASCTSTPAGVLVAGGVAAVAARTASC